MSPALHVAQKNRTHSAFVAPPAGLNVADPAGSLALTDALMLNNCLRSENGLRPRLGYKEHCTGLGSPSASAVRTVVPYTGAVSANDKLFACTADGIYDVTTPSASPSRVFAFSVVNGESGFGVFEHFTTVADKFIAYTDEANGYHLYTESTNTWAAVPAGAGAGELNGATPADLAFVTSWKNRLWFVERDSSETWYLPVGAVTGTAVSYEFGTRLKYGGEVIGLWSWTRDGGAGMDDFLVVISTAGDVAIYQGTDPSSSSTFGLKGIWFTGTVPAGRRIATDIGGDLLVLTSQGVFPLSVLDSGTDKLDPGIYTTRNVAPLIASFMEQRRTLVGWDLRMHPGDNALLLILPQISGQGAEQLALGLTSKGWSRYQGLPIYSADTWRGSLYFGTSDGRVCRATGHADGIVLAGTGATAVAWSGLTSYQNLGSANKKRALMLRPEFITDGTPPDYNVAARYDFDLSAIGTTTPYGAAISGWDSALWDSGLWASDVGVDGQTVGAVGCGAHVAVAFNCATLGACALTGFRVTVDEGGLL